MTVPGLAVTEVDGVLTIRFDRPEAFNALTGEMTLGAAELLEGASARDDVRVVVLTGTGPAFSTGADIAGEDAHERFDIRALDAANRLVRSITGCAKPVGERIANLAYGGVPVAGPEQFVMAINNYRQSGGGGFPHVATAPVVYNRQVEIRQLLIDWVTANGVIDPAAFASSDWRLVSNGSPITVS